MLLRLGRVASSDLNSKDCGQAHATPLNLTAFPTAAGSAGDTVVLRAHPTGEAAKDGCRWLDDGDDQELMYFEMEEGSAKSKSVEYMGVRVTRPWMCSFAVAVGSRWC